MAKLFIGIIRTRRGNRVGVKIFFKRFKKYFKGNSEHLGNGFFESHVAMARCKIKKY